MAEPRLVDLVEIWLKEEKFKARITERSLGGRVSHVIHLPSQSEVVMVEHDSIWEMHTGRFDPHIRAEDPEFFNKLREILTRHIELRRSIRLKYREK